MSGTICIACGGPKSYCAANYCRRCYETRSAINRALQEAIYRTIAEATEAARDKGDA